MKHPGGANERLYKEVLYANINGMKTSTHHSGNGKFLAEEKSDQRIIGEICLEMVEWLKRSLIGEIKGFIDFDVLKDKLYHE